MSDIKAARCENAATHPNGLAARDVTEIIINSIKVEPPADDPNARVFIACGECFTEASAAHRWWNDSQLVADTIARIQLKRVRVHKGWYWIGNLDPEPLT